MPVCGVFLAIGLGLAACGESALAVDPLSWPVAEDGPFQAGFRSWDVTYEPVAGASRTVRMNVWYPTNATVGDPVLYLDGIADEVALGNAPAAASVHDDGYPVLVYSHGDHAFGGSAAYLMRRFASHGGVAIAPDHTGNVLTTLGPDPQGIWYERPLDLSAALDALDGLPGDDALALANTETAVVAGHSRGASTLWANLGATYTSDGIDAACPDCDDAQRALFDGGLSDARFVAGIPMAGVLRRAWFGDQGHESVAVPVLALTGSEDPVGQQEQWDTTLGVDLTWVEVDNACHETFALGLCGTLATDVGYDLVAAYALAFVRHHLLGDTSGEVTALLDGSEADGVVFQRRVPNSE